VHLHGIPVVLSMYKMTVYKMILKIKPIECKNLQEAQEFIIT